MVCFILRKDKNDWLKRCVDYKVEGVKSRGRTKMMSNEILQTNRFEKSAL